MAEFTVNPTRHDPYKNFQVPSEVGRPLRRRWHLRRSSGALKRSTEVITHREGGDPSTSRKSPGLYPIRRHHS